VKVLVVEDEEIKRTALRDDLKDAGYETQIAVSADDGMKMLQMEPFDVVVTDLRMPGMDGTTFLAHIHERWPDTQVIMMTAYATVNNAVQAMKLGAFDYIAKPFESEELMMVLEKIGKIRDLTRENKSLKVELAKAIHHRDIVGHSPAMRNAFDALDLAISSDVPVLICGETGTGKELFATTIHNHGPRKDKPFIGVSCAALSAQLMESELFGHVRGAFTGAFKNKPGRFELAHKGTLFLDDIDDVPLEVQVKLLRVLEKHPFERVGGIEPINTDARFIAATKVELQKEVRKGTFREDLFYRLSVLPIRIPPLRDRREDIPLLVNYFLRTYCGTEKPPAVDEAVMTILWDYDWPGNVRELQNVVRRILLGIGERALITSRDVPVEIRLNALQGSPPGKPTSFREAIEARERDLLIRALDDSEGNKSKAAAGLRMKLSTFRDKLAKHNIGTEQKNHSTARNTGG
jgi:DNA-binding NtrC family response regulator